MTKKANIYKGDTLIALEKQMSTAGDNDGKITRVVNSICDRYQAMLDSYTPTLPENEWMCLCDVLNGYAAGDVKQAVRGLHWSLGDSIELDGLGEKWGVNDTFYTRIKDMGFGEKLSIIHITQTFWTIKPAEDEQFLSMLKRAGARITE